MYSENNFNERLPLKLDDGSIVQFEVSSTGHQDVGFEQKSFKEVTRALESMINAVAATIHRTMPTKATVKFGIDVGLESGQLTTVIVKGSTKSNLEITLEWDRAAVIPSESQ